MAEHKKTIKKTEEQEKTEGEEIQTTEHLEKQVLYVVVVGALIVLIFLGVFAAIRSSNNFTYDGIPFLKNKLGSIQLYTAQVPGIDGGTISFDFRNDPRKLKDVKVDVNEELTFLVDRTIYVAIGDVETCEDNGIAAAGLGIFLSGVGMKNRKSALANETFAKEMNGTYVTCATNPDNTVIIIKSGNETHVKQTSNNCYELMSTDCEVLKSLEKFEFIVLAQYMNRLS